MLNPQRVFSGIGALQPFGDVAILTQSNLETSAEQRIVFNNQDAHEFTGFNSFQLQ
jgi:hypothetical protein